MARTSGVSPAALTLFEKKTYDAVVATSGGDYSTVTAALADGKTNIFVRKGTYNEPDNIIIRTEYVKVTGEDKFSTKCVFPAGRNGLVLYSNYAYIKGMYFDTFTNTGASAVVIGDGSTPGVPDFTKGNFNTLDDCYIRGTDSGTFALYASGNSMAAGAATVAAFDANTLSDGNVIKNCIIEGHHGNDMAVFALQKNGQFVNNKIIGGRLAYYMVRNCQADFTSLNSSAEGVFFAGPSYNNTLKALVINPTASGIKTQNQLEHPVSYPTYSVRNNDIQVNVYNGSFSGATFSNADENNISLDIDSMAFHGLYMENCQKNNLPFVQVRNPRQNAANTRGSGVYLVSNVIDNNFGDVTIYDTKVANMMHTAFANREDSTCTGNKINNLTTRGLSSDRNVWIQSNNWKITNADIQGGNYAGLYLNGALYGQFENIQCKNNTNDANNTYAEVWMTGNSTNNVIGKLITESTATNKAKYGVQFDAGSNNNTILNHQNIGAVTTAALDSGTGNSIGVTVTGSTLRNITQQNLGSNFNAAAGTAEQEVTGLRVTLPVLSGTYTIKITSKVYINTAATNNNMRIRLGTDTSTVTNNTEYDNQYVSGAKTLESFTGVVVVTGVDLSSQKYVFYSVNNSTDATGMSLSASGSRSTIVVEVYK